ncbi:sulfite exporter TauE/SafE family protein, partial [bacterium]|nr:sulfite exporter TauE/SafE family protein [bacterium]
PMSWIIPDVAQVNPLFYILLTAGGTFIIGLSKAGFGGSVGILATPLFLLALPGNVALSMILPLLIVCDIFTWRQFPTEWHPKSYVLLCLGALVGLGFGLYCLLWFGQGDVDGDRWIRIIVGVVSLFFCILKVFRSGRERPAFEPNLLSGGIIGALAGFVTMVAHAAGPLVNMFLLPQRLDRRVFVGTTARYYLTMNSLKVPLYVAASFLAKDLNYITLDTLKWDAWLVIFGILGVAAGAWLNRRMSGQIFNAVIYVFLAITGAKMLYDGIFPT